MLKHIFKKQDKRQLEKLQTVQQMQEPHEMQETTSVAQSNRNRNVWGTRIEQVSTELARHKILYIIIIVVVMLATSYIVYQGMSQTATVSIALNYEEATRGLYPNQTRFNISLIKSDEVLERAIRKAGLTGQITAQDMADNITAWAASVDGMQLPSGTTNYKIATTYTINYTRNKELGKRISTQDMLSLIVESYKEIFYEKYTYVEVALEPDWSECDDEEYMEIGSFFEKECNKIRRFLKSHANENKTFRSDSIGESFVSLRQRIDNFIGVDLEKYNSYVLQSGLSKNKERYISKLNYQNFLKNIDYQKYMEEYQNRLHTMDVYDSSLTAVVLIPTLDTQNNFYMSRTKIESDYQASAAESANSSANDTMASIQQNEYMIRQMENSTAVTPSNIATAESMIQSMKNKITDIVEKTRIVNKEYVRYKTKNYLTVSFEEHGIADLLGIKWSVLTGCITFCIISLNILRKNQQKNNKSRKMK